MQFALIGDHPDGRNLASALVATGRHRLLYHVSSQPLALPSDHQPLRAVTDVEEIFADPAIELVVIASKLHERPAQLRRALQSERDVVCVHPVEDRPDTAYEAALIATDSRCTVLPLLTETFHPAIARVRELMERDSPLGPRRMLILERSWLDAEALTSSGNLTRPTFPGWHLLRSLGGEIVEVSALAVGEALEPDEPLLVAGRFDRGGLFQIAYVPGQSHDRFHLRLVCAHGEATLSFPHGLEGIATLRYTSENGTNQEQTWGAWAAWADWVTFLETRPRPTSLTWQDEIRSLELDDAVRRSLERRRTSLLDFQEATEEVGFKGTMTLVGCGVLWLIMFAAIASRWVSWIGWLIVPLLIFFLGMQLLGFLTRQPPADSAKKN